MSALNCRTEIVELDSLPKWAWQVGKGLVEENSGAIKGLGIAAFGITARTVTQEGETGDGVTGVINTLIDNPLEVMLWSAGVAGGYGLAYSVFNNGMAVLRERAEAKSEHGKAAERVRLANMTKLEEELTKQATRDDGTVDEDKLDNIKVASGFYRMKKKKGNNVTGGKVFNALLGTTIAEATEGLDVGIKLTLLPAFLVAKTAQLITYAITLDNQGYQIQDIITAISPELLRLVPVAALGGWALVKDAITVIQQRSNFVVVSDQ